ncbi:MAG: SpoIIE family protein phosphatase [Thermoanaerobaculia bacterium]
MDAIVLPGVLDSLGPIRGYVREAAEKAGLEKTATYKLSLAVDEIASNIVMHGYDEAGLSGEIRIWSELDGPALKIHLEDTGASYEFSHDEPANLHRPLSERTEGGFGVYLAIQGVDGVDYKTEGGRNRHTFVMDVTRHAPLDRQATLDILRKIPLWAGVNDQSLDELASKFKVMEFAAGRTVFNEGDPGDRMYVIARGTARIHRGERTFKKIGPLDFFGEMALFDDAPRTASVSAVDDLTLLSLDKEAFLHLLGTRIDVAIGMLHEFSDRLNGFLRTIAGLRDFVEKDLLPLGVALASDRSVDRILTRILDEARKHCRADSGAIYLLNESNGLEVELLFRESMGVGVVKATESAIRYPPVSLKRDDGAANTAHVVGLVGNQGRSVNLADVCDVTEFDFAETRALDQITGYRSKSCLTVPLKDYEDHVIGVVQLVNCTDPETGEVVPFGAYEQLVSEALASMAAVALNTERLLSTQKEFAKVERDLEIGRQIQLDFLPEHLPELPGWEIDTRFHTARQVGGDFYDVFPIGDGKIAFAVADVCDKGVGAALYMALSRSLIRAFVWQDNLQENVEKVHTQRTVEGAPRPVTLANDYLTSFHLKMNMFVTLFFGVLDPVTGHVQYVNAGHNAPAVITGEGKVKARLTTTAPALGMMPGARYKMAEVTLDPGDSLLAFTDGVTEARSPTRTFYTDERLVALLERPWQSAKTLLDEIEADMHEHVQDAEQSDDITILGIRRVPA